MLRPIQKGEKYAGHRRVGARLNEPIVESLTAHRSESIKPLLYAVHVFDKAHLVALTESGSIPVSAGKAMLSALRELEMQGIEEFRIASGGGAHSAEYALMPLLGEGVAGHINYGRSSMDLGSVSLTIYLRDRLLNLCAALIELRRVLIERAKREKESILPTYTQNQQGQVTTLAHQLVAWEMGLARSTQRLLLEYENLQISAAGAAAATGSGLEIDRERTAHLMGFHRASPNTFDAVMHHDVEIAVSAALATLGYDLSRISDDLLIYTSIEFGFIDWPDRFCGTSSIMMQKKNAYAPQHVKGIAAAAAGIASAMLLVSKGNTGLVSADRKYVTGGLVDLFPKFEMALGWMTEFFPELEFRVDRARASAAENWATATDLGALLVEAGGVSWRTAHQIVAITVRQCMEEGIKANQVGSQEIRAASAEYLGREIVLPDEAIRKALDPEHFVQVRTIQGGPAASAVESSIDECARKIDLDRDVVDEAQRTIGSAQAELEAAIDAILAK